MPLFYQKDINENTKLAVWKIAEEESFFLATVPVQSFITHQHKRLQHLAGRYLLRHLFADFPYHDIEIAQTRKPFLASEQYHFSISHCGDYAAAIVSATARVGIDVELVTPRVQKIKHKFLHADELQFVHAQTEDKQVDLLSLLWSAKEAMYKWYGLGEVDFSEMLRTHPFELDQTGQIHASFIKKNLLKNLVLEYKLWPKISLVWVLSA